MHLVNPVSRLKLVQQEIGAAFGTGYAAQHPGLMTAALQAATADWCVAIERIALALELPEGEPSASKVGAGERAANAAVKIGTGIGTERIEMECY